MLLHDIRRLLPEGCPQQLLGVLERVAGLLDRPAAAAAEPAAALAEDEPENDTSTAATQWTAVSYVNPALNRLPAGLDPGLAPQPGLTGRTPGHWGCLPGLYACLFCTKVTGSVLHGHEQMYVVK